MVKVGKAKHYRRIMRFYRLQFKISEPYRVLCDGNFVFRAIEEKLSLFEFLPRYLGGPGEMCSTPCIMHELRALGEDAAEAVHLLERAKILRCKHKDAVSPAECIKSMTAVRGKRNRYVVATQDHQLRVALREFPGIPLLYLNLNAFVIEDPSPATRAAAVQAEEDKMGATKEERRVLEEAKRRAIAEAMTPAEAARRERLKNARKKVRGPKEPNPLSRPKPKKRKQAPEHAEPESQDARSRPKKTRTRSRSRSKKKKLESAETS